MREKCEEAIKSFIFGFRQKYCQQEKSNIFLYDDESVKDLIDIYPLRGDKLDFFTLHFIAESPFDVPDYVRMYP